MKISKIIAGFIIVGAMSACGSQAETKDTVSANSSKAQSVSVDDEFLHDIGLYMTPELSLQPDRDLIALGNTVCSALDDDISMTRIIDAGSAPGALSVDAMSIVYAASIVNLCPEYN